jgi:imidazole glycerol-phosphate synthase subunit HisH
MLKARIIIIDYGVGNTYSVANAIKYLGYGNIKVSDNYNDIKNGDALILPGVGAFDEAMKNLKSRNLHNMLGEEVLVNEKPILGVCVGMQMLATNSEENGIHDGLNWIEGRVKKLELSEQFAVPHVGWNNVNYKNGDALFSRNSAQSNFYFDHSYYFDCDEKYVSAYCDYGIKVTAAVHHKNIFGVQFHPEKSQTNGLKLFRSFFNLI